MVVVECSERNNLMIMRLGTRARYATILEINRAVNTHHGLSEIFQVVCEAVNEDNAV